MEIAILGAGSVGLGLGSAWAARHHVTYGVRDTTKAGPPGMGWLPVADAVKEAEVVVLTVPWKAVPHAIAETGALDGKIVIDCTNPLTPDLAALELGLTTSAAEQIAAWLPKAYVFKAFNHTGAENLASVAGYLTAPVMLVCGDDAKQKPVVLGLVSELGFEAVDAGDLLIARLLEPLAVLWIHLAYRQKLGRDFAFALVHRR